MKTEILNFIINWTSWVEMDVQSTKDVAVRFGITTKEAFKICSELANEKLITKLESMDNHSKCDWIVNKATKSKKVITVPVRVFTFVHKDTQEVVSISGDKPADDKELNHNVIEGAIFGNVFDRIRINQVIWKMEEQGHTVIITDADAVVEIESN